MASQPSSRPRRPPRPIRILRMRPRRFVSATIGLVIIAVLPGEWRLTRRLLIGWDMAVALYLVLAFQMMAGADVARIRRRAASQDEGQTTLLVLTVAAALASL